MSPDMFDVFTHFHWKIHLMLLYDLTVACESFPHWLAQAQAVGCANALRSPVLLSPAMPSPGRWLLECTDDVVLITEQAMEGSVPWKAAQAALGRWLHVAARMAASNQMVRRDLGGGASGLAVKGDKAAGEDSGGRKDVWAVAKALALLEMSCRILHVSCGGAFVETSEHWTNAKPNCVLLLQDPVPKWMVTVPTPKKADNMYFFCIMPCC